MAVKIYLKEANLMSGTVMSKVLFVITLLLLPGLMANSQSAGKIHLTKPNIIIFLVDDMGWQDTSVPFWDRSTPFNKKYHTPNMERLAKQGVKFTNAYAAPVCTPTRVSLMTGMNVAHHKVTNWTSPLKDNNTDNADDQMAPAPWLINGFSPVPGVPRTVNATPLPMLLKNSGYFTIHAGKAHWASQGTPGANPYNLGFMVNISGHAAGHPQSYQGKDNYGNLPGKATAQAVPDLEEYYGTDTFLTKAVTLEAIKALEAPVKNKQPFFLYLAQYAVHTPIQPYERFVKKYQDAGLDEREANYASLLEGMDESLGDLMDFVEQKKIDNNTIIIFMSDNGGLSTAPRRAGEAFTHNLPLKAGKGSVYEGGIREPMIVKWPGVVKPATIASQYIIIEDFFPTILEIAGVKNYKTIQTVDGKSFVNILKNNAYSDNTRSLIWHFPNKWIPENGPGINYKSAIRQGEWKLIYNMRSGTKELYNLDTDIEENKNVAEQFPGKVKLLASLMSKQMREWKSPMPLFKNTNQPVPFADEAFPGQ